MSRLDLIDKLAVTMRPVSSLVPYAKNSRTHSEAQLSQIAAAITKFGWTNPILLDEFDGIIAGHARALVAHRKLKLKEVPCIVLPGLTDEEKRAIVISDNQLSLGAGWDIDILVQELGDILSDGFSLIDEIGFSQHDLDTLLHGGAPGGGLTDEDEVPAEHDIAVSELGDVWLLGDHRLACGDSTDPLIVDKALNGVKPHLMVTDPPYGVEYDAGWRATARNKDGKLLSTGSGRAKGKVENDAQADWREAWGLFPGEVVYVWHGERQLIDMGAQLRDCGFELRNLIVWGKQNLVIGRGHYHSKHETCWYAVKKGATGHWAGDRKQTTLWEIQHQKSETGHSTQKPVECMRRPIVNNSSPGQAVYDPFVGSGTTIVAAETTGRTCHSIEINPKYADVSIRRWQAFAGQTATLEGDGRTFDEIAASRIP